MAKLEPDKVVAAALDLLGEVGLAGISTRRLAHRLGVEQPALYWHFRNKAALLDAMASTAMCPHAAQPVPEPPADWQAWFVDNMRGFRRTLLAHRDGALLHAGSRPHGENVGRIERKIAFLVASGFSDEDAAVALLGAGRFTLGCVLEEQAEREEGARGAFPAIIGASSRAVPNHPEAFEAGLDMMVHGLAGRRAGR